MTHSRMRAPSFAAVLSPLVGIAASLAGLLPARGADVPFAERVISTGACCDRHIGTCRNDVEEADCDGAAEEWSEGISCDTLEPPCVPPTPPHDECDACIPVSTGVPYDEGTTIGATGTDITSCTIRDREDVWHCWTADCTGAAVISLCGSSYDTALAVFDACGGMETRIE